SGVPVPSVSGVPVQGVLAPVPGVHAPAPGAPAPVSSVPGFPVPAAADPGPGAASPNEPASPGATTTPAIGPATPNTNRYRWQLFVVSVVVVVVVGLFGHSRSEERCVE